MQDFEADFQLGRLLWILSFVFFAFQENVWFECKIVDILKAYWKFF